MPALRKLNRYVRFHESDFKHLSGKQIDWLLSEWSADITFITLHISKHLQKSWAPQATSTQTVLSLTSPLIVLVHLVLTQTLCQFPVIWFWKSSLHHHLRTKAITSWSAGVLKRTVQTKNNWPSAFYPFRLFGVSSEFWRYRLQFSDFSWI